jgi:carboxylate-amine ligase
MIPILPAFSGYGIELEFMIVHQETLSVLPIADKLLYRLSGKRVSEVRKGLLGWSNELVLHLIELKNVEPHRDIESLARPFQDEIQQIDHLLRSMDAMLMPTAMHPFMDPRIETQLWPHDNVEIYRAYDRIFNCRRHGWANLQSMHLNLPFANDDEFARLHAAIRLLLPILPALAASSPIMEGSNTGFLDFRMEAYCTHQMEVPSTIGRVIPPTVTSRTAYEAEILAPMYRDIAAFGEEGVLQHEWLNARGEVPRFDRNAIEIRMIDTQECVKANLAIAAAVVHVVRLLYKEESSSLTAQQAISTDDLVKIMHDCIRYAEQAGIEDPEYLSVMGFPVQRCKARELWTHLVEPLLDHVEQSGIGRSCLQMILEQGTLARRILRAVGGNFSPTQLQTIYRELCDCLYEGRMFSAG